MRDRNSFDVVVVGCGPAGAAAGKAAAENGADVLVLEKKQEIGIPVIEAAASIYNLSELEEIAGVRFNRERVVASQLYGIAYIPESGQTDRYHEWPDGAVVRRTDFEQKLAIAAARAGAEIRMGSRFAEAVRDDCGQVCGVIYERDGERVEVACRGIIACDGAMTDAGVMSGLDLPFSITAGYGIEFANVKRVAEVPLPVYESYLVKELPGVTCWVTPRGDDIFAVGVGAHISRPGEKRPLKVYHKTFMQYLEEKGRFDFSKASEIHLIGGVTTGVESVERLAADGFILAGDAARRPLFGSRYGGTGMPSAVFTGKCAGEVMARAVRSGELTGEQLQTAYRGRIDATFPHPVEDRMAIAEAKKWNARLSKAPADVQNRVIEEIGSEYSKLHLYVRGGLQFADCAEKIEKFWESHPELA